METGFLFIISSYQKSLIHLQTIELQKMRDKIAIDDIFNKFWNYAKIILISCN